MPDPSQLPHLLKLLDDDSADIQETVRRELLAFGNALEEELDGIKLNLTHSQETLLQAIISEHRSAELRETWLDWTTLDDVWRQLEAAYARLAAYFSPRQAQVDIGKHLDALANEYHERQGFATVFELARFLFESGRLKGADNSYYDPRNSDLGHVLIAGEGIPISLAAVFMLVGRRLDLKIHGCNFPGHFLARTQVDNVTYLVDCYNGGRFIQAEDLITAQGEQASHVRQLVANDMDALSFMARVIRNLTQAFQRKGDKAQLLLMVDLLNALEHEAKIRSRREGETPEAQPPRFKPGHLIKHRRYGYRGVVVDYDMECHADEDWYQANQTQPDRGQPWYHVLVHESSQTTYTAQSSLELDDSGQAVKHPLLAHFFNEFVDGVYIRNGHPWPGTQ